MSELTRKVIHLPPNADKKLRCVATAYLKGKIGCLYLYILHQKMHWAKMYKQEQSNRLRAKWLGERISKPNKPHWLFRITLYKSTSCHGAAI